MQLAGPMKRYKQCDRQTCTNLLAPEDEGSEPDLHIADLIHWLPEHIKHDAPELVDLCEPCARGLRTLFQAFFSNVHLLPLTQVRGHMDDLLRRYDSRRLQLKAKGQRRDTELIEAQISAIKRLATKLDIKTREMIDA